MMMGERYEQSQRTYAARFFMSKNIGIKAILIPTSLRSHTAGIGKKDT